MLASAKWPTSWTAGGIAFGPSVSPNVRPMEAESNENDRVEFSGCHFPCEHPAKRGGGGESEDYAHIGDSFVGKR